MDVYVDVDDDDELSCYENDDKTHKYLNLKNNQLDSGTHAETFDDGDHYGRQASWNHRDLNGRRVDGSEDSAAENEI